MNLTERIVALHEALQHGGVPHAFGGALALAWCIARPRMTIDIDLNLFVRKRDAGRALKSLPPAVAVSETTLRWISQDGQARLRWDETPVDVFFSTSSFHDEAETRVRFERFGGSRVPFLACRDLAVFKAFFNRPQDWVDLEAMAAACSIDPLVVAETLARYVGDDDLRVSRLRSI